MLATKIRTLVSKTQMQVRSNLIYRLRLVSCVVVALRGLEMSVCHRELFQTQQQQSTPPT